MEAVVRLDTHLVVWLYAGMADRLSKLATDAINNNDIVISPMVELELTYLYEIGRLTVSGPAITADLRDRIGLTQSEVPLAAVIQEAGALSWTRDPFDRIIVGDAHAAKTKLISKDQLIRDNSSLGFW